MVDGRCAHGGLVDRFKGIVTLYALSKVYNVPYYINYISPFNLNEVLCPNKYDWRITNEILDYSLFRSRVLVAYSEFKNPYRVLRIDLKKQNHVYYGYNSLKLINEVFNTNFEWGELFEELFLPSEELRNYIDDFKKVLQENILHYISVLCIYWVMILKMWHIIYLIIKLKKKT